MVKNLPANARAPRGVGSIPGSGRIPGKGICLPMQETPETWVQSLGREDSLEKERQLIPVFLPGKVHGQRSLAGYSPWVPKSWP